MNESDETTQRRDDPADALADLAKGRDEETIVLPEQADPLTSLDEMAEASGMGLDPADSIAELAKTAEDTAASEAVSAGGAGVLPLPQGEAPVAPAKGVSAANAGRPYLPRYGSRLRRDEPAGKHHAHMYKKTMIPLLLVVGALLVVIGLVAVVMLLRAETGDESSSWYPRMKVVTLISFPLAAAMLFGAWWFHRDVKNGSQ